MSCLGAELEAEIRAATLHTDDPLDGQSILHVDEASRPLGMRVDWKHPEQKQHNCMCLVDVAWTLTSGELAKNLKEQHSHGDVSGARIGNPGSKLLPGAEVGTNINEKQTSRRYDITGKYNIIAEFARTFSSAVSFSQA
jgi:hypothetical protein